MELLMSVGLLLGCLALGALVVPNQGETILLEALVNKTAPQNLSLHLNSNNVTPAETDTEAAYTEMSGNGYAAVNPLTPASWTATPGAPSSIAYPEQTFTFTGAAGNCYGYYIKQVTSGKLVWSERFSGAPWVINNNGDQIKVPPTITAE